MLPFQNAAEANAGHQEEAGFVVQLFIYAVGKYQLQTADQIHPRPHPTPCNKGDHCDGQQRQETSGYWEQKKKSRV